MYNTFGLRSVNRNTFNMKYHDSLEFPREWRNVGITALRLNNAVLNVLGYIGGISFFSGCVRMVIGVAIIGTTLVLGDRNAIEGLIIGRWYDEAIGTGIAQIARGALEAIVPYGWVANAVLDVIATPFNLSHEIEGSMACEGCLQGFHTRPHEEVTYPLVFKLLHLV